MNKEFITCPHCKKVIILKDGNYGSLEEIISELKSAREQKGWSISKAARSIKVTRISWINWERGKSVPTSKNFRKIYLAILWDRNSKINHRIWKEFFYESQYTKEK